MIESYVLDFSTMPQKATELMAAGLDPGPSRTIRFVLADGVGAVPAWHTGQTSFVVGTVGRAVILAGIALATARETRPPARQP